MSKLVITAGTSASKSRRSAFTWYENSDEGVQPGLVETTAIPLPPKAIAYLCGPIEFKRDVHAGLSFVVGCTPTTSSTRCSAPACSSSDSMTA